MQHVSKGSSVMKLKYKQAARGYFARNEVGYPMRLNKEKEYVVLGISFNQKNRYVCLDTHDGLPVFLDIRQFDVVSNYVPSRWTVRYKSAFDNLSFFPQSWIETGAFWRGVFEKKESKMLALYYQERDLIFGEEPA
jgi:hypothetical protein